MSAAGRLTALTCRVHIAFSHVLVSGDVVAIEPKANAEETNGELAAQRASSTHGQRARSHTSDLVQRRDCGSHRVDGIDLGDRACGGV